MDDMAAHNTPASSYEGTPDLPLPVLRRMALHGAEEVSKERETGKKHGLSSCPARHDD